VNRNQFIRPFNSTKGDEGMGICVYQAREFIRRLGGQLNVASEPHDGTTVTITIPLDQAH